MKKLRLRILQPLVLAATLSGCGLFDSAGTDLRVEYMVSGGFSGWGPFMEHLVVADPGVVTYKTGYPELTLELGQAKYDSIRTRIIGLYYLTRTRYFWPGAVRDDVDFEIRVRSKTFRGSTSYLYDQRDSPEFVVVYVALETLHDLVRYTYKHAAPWIGLQFEAASLQSQYALGDTIKVLYTLRNPTAIPRNLPFPHQNQMRFQASGGDCASYYCYLVPDPNLRDDSPPSIINLPPGDEWHEVLIWAQPFTDPHGEERVLQPGQYRIGMYMDNGYFPAQWDSIEIVGPLRQIQ